MMFKAIGDFFSLWFARFRKFAFLFATWAVVFASVTLADLKVAFEYDDGFAFTTPSIQAALGEKLEDGSPAFWEKVNASWALDRAKPVPWLAAWTFRIAGFGVEAVAVRPEKGADSLISGRRPLIRAFHFADGDDGVYRLLERERYLIYFAASDSGIIQARKAGVKPARVRRSSKSLVRAEHNPRKFGEKVLPLTEF